MTARVTLLGLLLLAMAVAQTSLLPLFGLTVLRPDLLLLVVVAVALHDGPLSGLRVGFAAGLLTDLLVLQSPVGMAALIVTTIGFAIGTLRPYLAPDSVTAPLLVALAATFVGTFGFGVLVRLLGEDRASPAVLLQGSATVALASTLVAPFVLRGVHRLLLRVPVRGGSLADDI